MIFLYIVIVLITLYLAKPLKGLKSKSDFLGYLAIAVMVSGVIIVPLILMFGY